MASYRLITIEDANSINGFLDWIRENMNTDSSQQETLANGIMNASNILMFGSGGMDTSDELGDCNMPRVGGNACFHRNRVATHRGEHCVDCGRRF